jgi:hypothetical protein
MRMSENENFQRAREGRQDAAFQMQRRVNFQVSIWDAALNQKSSVNLGAGAMQPKFYNHV